MSGIMRSVVDFAAKAAQMGSVAAKEIAKKHAKKPAHVRRQRVRRQPALSRFYCLRRLRALRRSAVRPGGSYRLPFGSRFSVRMPRVRIRPSPRAQQINKVCETVVNGTAKLALAER